jgi:hypothetical protein
MFRELRTLGGFDFATPGYSAGLFGGCQLAQFLRGVAEGGMYTQKEMRNRRPRKVRDELRGRMSFMEDS